MTKTIEIPGYKIKKELGSGGMARVYLADEKKLERPVALKVLTPAIAENPKITKRFIKEAKTAAQLDHTNIVSIFDVGKHQGFYYIAMEYLAGNLKEKIKSNRSIKPLEALAVMKEVAKALSYAHNRGYIHRDIKPDNIMFRKDGAVVLVDFGIVKAMNELENTKLTSTGTSIGTPQYMSPEQIKARKVDGRSDIYSLGVVLYEMLTGTVPFKADSIVTVALQHLDEPVPELPKRLKELQPLIDKMMAKSPRERVRNAEGLIRLIDAMIHQLKTRKENVNLPEQPKRKTKRKLLPWLVFLLLAGGGIAGSYYFIDYAREKAETAAWENAKKVDSRESYQNYLDNYREGKYGPEANSAVKQKESEEKYNEAVKETGDYLEQKEYQHALEVIARAKKIEDIPDSKLKELDQMEANVLIVIKANQLNGYLDRAWEYYNNGQWKLAGEFVRQAKQMGPDSITAADELKTLERKILELRFSSLD
ncbi:MAG: serine/threonine protein kinase [bacterium]|nr:serine/threonine protein kinase [bacterium]